MRMAAAVRAGGVQHLAALDADHATAWALLVSRGRCPVSRPRTAAGTPPSSRARLTSSGVRGADGPVADQDRADGDHVGEPGSGCRAATAAARRPA